MWHWLWCKLTGQHYCDEFTQWVMMRCEHSRPAKDIMEVIAANTHVITYTKRWQERKCTICGKVQQRELDR